MILLKYFEEHITWQDRYYSVVWNADILFQLSSQLFVLFLTNSTLFLWLYLCCINMHVFLTLLPLSPGRPGRPSNPLSPLERRNHSFRKLLLTVYITLSKLHLLSVLILSNVTLFYWMKYMEGGSTTIKLSKFSLCIAARKYATPASLLHCRYGVYKKKSKLNWKAQF